MIMFYVLVVRRVYHHVLRQCLEYLLARFLKKEVGDHRLWLPRRLLNILLLVGSIHHVLRLHLGKKLVLVVQWHLAEDLQQLRRKLLQELNPFIWRHLLQIILNQRLSRLGEGTAAVDHQQHLVIQWINQIVFISVQRSCTCR